MIPRTPRGFRDVLPAEAVWRLAIREAANERYKLWGYVPVETPTVELASVMGAAGTLEAAPFRFFDSDGRELVLRPDVTLPVARMAALRMGDTDEPLRLCYAHQVFNENDSAYALDRQVTQSGIECIGPAGPSADAEVLCLLFEALAATGLTDFTVAIGTVGVLNALVERASGDGTWRAEAIAAFHASDLVSLRRLATDERVSCEEAASAVPRLAKIRGGREAFDECRELIEPLGLAGALACLSNLEFAYDIVTASLAAGPGSSTAAAGAAPDAGPGSSTAAASSGSSTAAAPPAGRLLVDFSVITSLDYYSGMVLRAWAPGVAKAIASGGRYDHTLAAFGCDRPAAGFAIALEPLMQALRREGVEGPSVGPERSMSCDASDRESVAAMFAEARGLRERGVRVTVEGEGARS